MRALAKFSAAHKGALIICPTNEYKNSAINLARLAIICSNLQRIWSISVFKTPLLICLSSGGKIIFNISSIPARIFFKTHSLTLWTILRILDAITSIVERISPSKSWMALMDPLIYLSANFVTFFKNLNNLWRALLILENLSLPQGSPVLYGTSQWSLCCSSEAVSAIFCRVAVTCSSVTGPPPNLIVDLASSSFWTSFVNWVRSERIASEVLGSISTKV